MASFDDILLNILKVTSVLARDPRGYGIAKTLQDQGNADSQERQAMENAFGPMKSHGITWNTPHQLPTGMVTALQGGGLPTNQAMPAAPVREVRGYLPEVRQAGLDDFRQKLSGAPSIQALLAKQAFAPAAEPTVSKPGDIARNRDGSIAWENPAPPTATAASNLVTMKFPNGKTKGYDATTQQREIAEALAQDAIEVKTPPSQVNVNMTPENKALGEVGANSLGERRTAATSALESSYAMRRQREALEAGLKTGPSAGAKDFISTWLVDLGANPNAVGAFYNFEAGADYDAASKELTRAVIKAFGANPSNSDREFAEKMAPQLKTNPQAAVKIMERLEAKNKVNVGTYRSMLGSLKDNPNSSILLAELDALEKEYAGIGGAADPKKATPDYSKLPAGSTINKDGSVTGPNGQPLVWENE